MFFFSGLAESDIRFSVFDYFPWTASRLIFIFSVISLKSSAVDVPLLLIDAGLFLIAAV